jgi:tRNA-2-methylthio-N6-dimethylallyladenosine synthase
MKVTKSKIKTLGSQVNPQNQSIDYLSLTQTRSDPTVANIIIQTGCDNFCTYCIVPHARGREYSRDPNAIIEEVKKAISQGYKEVLLIGQNVNSYGKEQRLKTWNNETMTWQSSDVKTPFRELLNELDALKGIDRIRFTSSNPHDMTKDILDAHFELPNICHHLHIALQSGDNTTLKAMNRRHSVEDFERIVTHLRARDPLFSITTDLIVGFPGETEEQFENTLRAYRACQFDFAFIAQYSERKGTFAADHLDDNVSKETKLQRWHALNDLLAETTFERNRLMIGQNETVLVSAHDPKLGYSGRTRNFKEVFIDIKDSLAIGDLVKVTITEAKNWYLRGKILGK